MTQLLASVTGVEEAIWALEYGADIIDLKNPSAGALGALPANVIRDVVSAIAGRAITSATVGDLPMEPDLLANAVWLTAKTGVNIVKVGFFTSENHAACIAAMKPIIEQGVKVIAVLFADQKPDINILPLLSAAEFYGVMLDTARKDGLSLVDHQSLDALISFVNNAKASKLKSGLAGSLRMEHISCLQQAHPDYMGFRGALCQSYDRTTMLDKNKIAGIKKVLHKNNKNLHTLSIA